MPSLSGVLLILLGAMLIYSMVDAHSFSPESWARGLIVFRETVQAVVTPDPSIIGRQISTKRDTLKLLDNHICLFRRHPRLFELRTVPLLGEIHIDEQSYVVLGRLPFSQWLTSLALVTVITTLLLEPQGMPRYDIQTIASSLREALVLAGIVFAFLAVNVMVERDRMRGTYLRVIDRLAFRRQ
jgi:hypothetical protein